jgi:acetate kinase
MPLLAQQLPLPRKLWASGLQRFGFHGLSYEFIVQALGPEEAAKRVIVAHLGNGSSLAAIRNGRSVETTMGFSPTGGVMMGSRTGDIDPSALLFLLRQKPYGATELEKLVNEESGLRGVSEISSDMKTLLERSDTDHRAHEAVDLYCYSVSKHIGALAAVLGGLDTLVFTGGIGERAAPVRSKICEPLGFLGIALDRKANDGNAAIISAPGAACKVPVIETNEELVICRHTQSVVFA